MADEPIPAPEKSPLTEEFNRCACGGWLDWTTELTRQYDRTGAVDVYCPDCDRFTEFRHHRRIRRTRGAEEDQLKKLERWLKLGGMIFPFLALLGAGFTVWIKLSNVELERKVARLEWQVAAQEECCAELRTEAREAAKAMNAFAVQLERALRGGR